MKKFVLSLLVIIVVFLVVVVLAKDLILKIAVEQAVTRTTGFKTSLGSLHYAYPSTIHIKNLEIDNPAGFKAKTFVKIPEIYASLVLSELLKEKKTHLPEVRLDIQEVNIEKNSQGVSNVEKLTALQGKTSKAPAKPAPSKPAGAFQLDRLELTVRHLSFEDSSNLLAKGGVATKMEIDLHLDKEVITNITRPDALVAVIVAKILNSATLGRVLDIDANALLKDGLSDVMSSGKVVGEEALKLTNQTVDMVNKNEVAQGAGNILGDSVDEAGAVIDETAKKAKEGVTDLFGKMGDLVTTSEEK